MKVTPSRPLMILLLQAALAAALGGQTSRKVSESPVLRVLMAECRLKAERPPSMRALFSSKVAVTRRGFFEVNGERVWIFLPDRWKHTIENDENSSDSFENEASYFYLNQRKDKKLTADEAWFCDTPFRVCDRMFEVVDIDPDGAWIEIRSSKKPVSGIVIGRRLPPFSWISMSGQPVNQDTYRGKYLVIDIWSPT